MKARSGLLFATVLTVSTVQAETILLETFESGSFDSRISISTLGTFSSASGIKSFSLIEGNKAFGFGRSTNRFNSFGNFVTSLTITLPNPTFVTGVSFKEMEIFENWGSGGSVSADGVSLTPSNVFGRLPYNDRIADSTFRNHDFAVNRVVSKIVFRVEDITDLSEIYIDQITVSAIPEPTSALLLALGVSAIALGRRNRSKTGDVS